MGRRSTKGRRQGQTSSSAAGRKTKRKGRIGFRGALNIVLTTVAICFVFGLIAGIPASITAYGYLLRELPSPENIANRNTFKTARILDRNDRLLYEIIDPQGGRRTIVPLANIARPMQLATIAVEDATFYVNPGFDIRGIARALWLNFRGNQVLSGASTITQQLVKNTLLTAEVSLHRKLKEAVLAWEISRRYSKDEILEMYLNEIYYGNMAYGVEAAAQTYFGKRAQLLSLAEGALLAGMVQSPVEYDPWTKWPEAKERQLIVLDLMTKCGFVSSDEAIAAGKEKLALRRRSEAIAVPLKAPHFAMFVRDLLERSYGREILYHGGLEVRTSLDLDLQRIAENAVTEQLARIKRLNANNASLVAIDPNSGEILAMVGSADYFDDTIDGQVNIALSKRQPGSALKPFVYLSAFAKGYTPASILQDVPTVFAGGYRPMNHDNKFRGPVRVREALANSLNVPAVQMLQAVGMDDALSLMHSLGITDLNDPQRYGLTLALGGGEVKLLDLTYAYTPLANGGFQLGKTRGSTSGQNDPSAYEPVAILQIADTSGKILYKYFQHEQRAVVDPQLAYLITSILSDDKARAGTYGRNSFLELARPAAAKTGTTDDFRDGWTVGYTPDLVAGVWVGNADNSPMLDVYGVSGAGLIWHNFMDSALKDKPPRDFVKPPGIKELTICKEISQPANQDCRETMQEVFAANSSRASPEVMAVPTKRVRGWEVAITSPAGGSSVYGMVDILGTAASPGTTSYNLSFARADDPERAQTMIVGRPFSVERNLLGRWDTTALPAGRYLLRLTVSDGQSTQVAMAEIAVSPPPGMRPLATTTPAPTNTRQPTVTRLSTVTVKATVQPTNTKAAIVAKTPTKITNSSNGTPAPSPAVTSTAGPATTPRTSPTPTPTRRSPTVQPSATRAASRTP